MDHESLESEHDLARGRFVHAQTKLTMFAISMPADLRGTVREYYRLTKPGIIYGNLITVIGGFLLASRWHVDFGLLMATMIGISAIMASGCVFNNHIDRDIDAKMERTKHRALVEGRIPGTSALIFGTILYILGAAVLALFTNLLALSVAIFGLIVYVFFYSLWSKRYSVHSTIIGALAGAVPPVVGYCTVTGRLDAAAVILFLILTIWQLPHAFAIGVYRLKDYADAGVPVLPVAYGVYVTKIAICVAIVLFYFAVALLSAYGYTGYYYLSVMTIVSVVWFIDAMRGFRTSDDHAWGRRMFLFSLLALLIFCLLISIDQR